jgi:hypothetical protein
MLAMMAALRGDKTTIERGDKRKDIAMMARSIEKLTLPSFMAR